MKQQSLFSVKERRSAVIDESGQYRYSLSRAWADGPRVLFVMLNPSTADAMEDDNTIRQLRRFVKRWGFGAFDVGNLYGFRATFPKDLKDHAEPVGPETNEHLRKMIARASLVVCGWGNPVPGLQGFSARAWQVVKMIPKPHVLQVTKKGHPWHPLYLANALTAVPWTPTFSVPGQVG